MLLNYSSAKFTTWWVTEEIRKRPKLYLRIGTVGVGGAWQQADVLAVEGYDKQQAFIYTDGPFRWDFCCNHVLLKDGLLEGKLSK